MHDLRTRLLARSATMLLIAMLIAAPALAETTIAVSLAASESAGGGGLGQTSANGRYSVFTSTSALTAGQLDANNADDVYLLDNATGIVTLVSRSFEDPRRSGTRASTEPRISADGAWIVFTSQARNLVDGFVDGSVQLVLEDIYLFERRTGVITLVSHAVGQSLSGASGDSDAPTISDDGRFVAFTSTATDLIDGFEDVNNGDDIYLYDRLGGTSTLVSHAAISPSKSGNRTTFGPVQVSDDGAWIAYASLANNLIPGFVDQNGAQRDVFLWARDTNTNTLVSHIETSAVTGGDRNSDNPWLSADGAHIAFDSAATDLLIGLVPVTPNGFRCVFDFERATGTVTLISHADGAPLACANGDTTQARISDDGEIITYWSRGTDLVPGFVDQNASGRDIYSWQRTTGTTTLVSHADGAPSAGSNGDSFAPALRADGGAIAYASEGTDLIAGFVDGNGAAAEDVYLFDRVGGTTTLVSRAAGTPSTGGNDASGGAVRVGDVIAVDSGTAVIYETRAGDLEAGRSISAALPNLAEFRTQSADNRLLSVRSVDAERATADDRSDIEMFPPIVRETVTDDGRFFVFTSEASNLLVGQAGRIDVGAVYVYDRDRTSIRLVSHAFDDETAVANGVSLNPIISADGAWVAFESAATDLVDGFVDQNGVGATARDIYLWESATGTVTLVSRSTTGANISGNRASIAPSFDDSGRHLAFESLATDLVAGFVDGNGFNSQDLFLFDRDAGTTTLVSHTVGSVTQGAERRSNRPRVSADGAFIAFDSPATDLIAGFVDGNGLTVTDVYLFERATGVVQLVSHVPGTPDQGGDARSAMPTIANDGAFMVFESAANDLVTGFVSTDGNNGLDLFRFDSPTGTVTLLSHAAGQPAQGGVRGGSSSAAISADGAFVVFQSEESNLVAGLVDVNGNGSDVFLHEIATDTTTLVSHPPGIPLQTASGASFLPRISGDGNVIAMRSRADDLVPGFVNPATFSALNIYRFDLSTGGRALLSRDADDPLIGGIQESSPPSLSRDGRYAAFTSFASNLARSDGNATFDVFLAGPDLEFDLALGLSGVPAAVAPLGSLSATFELTNLGPADGARPRVYIDLGGATLDSTTATDWQCNAFASAVVCDLLTPLDALASAPSIGVALTAPDAVGTFTIVGRVIDAGFDPDLGNDTATETVALTGNADLVIAKIADRMVAVPGEMIRYTLTAENLALTTVAPVTVTDPFPAATDCAWTSTSTGGVSGNTDDSGALADTLILPAGASVVYTVDCAIDETATGTLESTATIASPAPDPNPTDNDSTVSTPIDPMADLALDKAVNQPTVDPGGTLLYTFTVENLGPSTSSGSVVSDTLPAGLSFAASADGCTESAGDVTCPLGMLTPGATVAVSFTATVDLAAPPNLVNNATIVGDDTDPVIANDSDSTSTDVVNQPPRIARIGTIPAAGDGQITACESTPFDLRSLQVVFDESVADPPGDASPEDVTNPSNYRLVEAGPNGALDAVDCTGPLGDDIVSPVAGIAYDNASFTAELTLGGSGVLAPGRYQLLVCAGIEDLVGNRLDGDGDGTEGDDFLRDFRVDRGNAFVNGHFDCSLEDWEASSAVAGEIEHSLEDLDSAPASGSARLENLTAGNALSISQCLVAPRRGGIDLRGRVRFDTPALVVDARLTCQRFVNPDCTGPSGFTIIKTESISDTGGGWLTVAATGTLLSSPESLRCGFGIEPPNGDAFVAFLDQLDLRTGILFADGFESGDSSAWSQTVP